MRQSHNSLRASVRRPTPCFAATTRSREAPPTPFVNAVSSCPTAVSIVGFDNWEVMATATRPPLTSVDMNLKDLGRKAGARMLDMIAGKHLHGVQRLPCTLVVRESCGGGR